MDLALVPWRDDMGENSKGPKEYGQDDATGSDDIAPPPTIRSLRPAAVVPSLADEGDGTAESSVTALNPLPADTGLLAGAALPDFLAVRLDRLGPGEPQTFTLTMTRTIVGRGVQADVRLDDDGKVSRRHACILYVGNEFRVRDQGSGNGTLLNGSRVIEYALRHGDKILIGDTLLQFFVESRGMAL
jgi:hypothetical protein